ncbi:hypothetical protein ACFQO7_24425 [Catellatospora aurea]|uniref:MYXO-CTERM domain-containing protein n=1 Tax=Catellatospora aurea TaxID=1337874 RepID=A0ABW2H3Q8_9ACTN
MILRKVALIGASLLTGALLSAEVFLTLGERPQPPRPAAVGQRSTGPTYNCNVPDSCQVQQPRVGSVFYCQTEEACVTDARWTGKDISRAALAVGLIMFAAVWWRKRHPAFALMKRVVPEGAPSTR